MTTKRILYTRHDGGISVCGPAPEIFTIMQHGGYWDDRPHGFIDKQIERQIESGIAPDHARRFAVAVAFGGCSEAETWAIIRDRDCARHGTLHELIDASELPDRWFRDAWRRSFNGGPVGIDLAKARPIQWQRARTAVATENKRREEAFEPVALITPLWETLRSAIHHARDDEELQRIWPEGLPKPSRQNPAPNR